jgi:hypothetical protein
MEMDIARLSMNMASANAMTEISMKVFKMSLEQMEDVGSMLSSLTAAASVPVSVDPNIGQNLDISI